MVELAAIDACQSLVNPAIDWADTYIFWSARRLSSIPGSVLARASTAVESSGGVTEVSDAREGIVRSGCAVKGDGESVSVKAAAAAGTAAEATVAAAVFMASAQSLFLGRGLGNTTISVNNRPLRLSNRQQMHALTHQ